MGLRSFFQRNPARADAGLPAAGRIGPAAGEPMPEQLAELGQAWAELAPAAEGAGVRTFHTCTRDGTSWEEDPAAVRALAATLRGLRPWGPPVQRLALSV
jgi:hypothetical protein